MFRNNNVTDKKGRPIVFTYSFVQNDTMYQYLYLCPFCEGNHQHSAKRAEGDGGLRQSHCRKGGDLYHLFCLGQMPSPVRRHFEKRSLFKD